MLLPPAGEEHLHELFVEIMFVVNNPDYTVVDDVYHKRSFSVPLHKYGKNGNVTTENFFPKKKFRACNILLFFILMRKKDEQKRKPMIDVIQDQGSVPSDSIAPLWSTWLRKKRRVREAGRRWWRGGILGDA